MTVSALPAHARANARVKPRTATLLVLLVGASVLVRTLVGWARATPTYFPDEYLYAELGRSFADSGRPLVDGEAASLPAPLQPLLTATA